MNYYSHLLVLRYALNVIHLIHIRHARCNVKGYFKKYFLPASALGGEILSISKDCSWNLVVKRGRGFRKGDPLSVDTGTKSSVLHPYSILRGYEIMERNWVTKPAPFFTMFKSELFDNIDTRLQY